MDSGTIQWMKPINQQRIEILTRVKQGKLEISQAARDLQALNDDPEPETAGMNAYVAAHKKQRFIRILRTGMASGKTLVDLRLPLALVSAGRRIGALACLDRADALHQQLQNLSIAELEKLPANTVLFDQFDDEADEHTLIQID